MPETTALDSDRLARSLVADNAYISRSPRLLPVERRGHLRSGSPHPSWTCSSGHRSQARGTHENIAVDPRGSLVIFDTSKAPGEGSALYLSADAELVDDAALEDSLALYNARALERGLSKWTRAKLREPAKHCLYRAVTLESFVLDDHDERVRLP